ncbi:hypothetical protein GQX74_011141 [Glossina fuscipes]|nr:hypothetical protein GQX74_011141 [Glossina fuscipes]
MMLTNLSILYQPKMVSIKSSGANITDDYVKRNETRAVQKKGFGNFEFYSGDEILQQTALIENYGHNNVDVLQIV